mmetsp:Transcript_11893/g.32142  ORF Transcript_11893/g.32142 Transcript_11893/m.32142 type:complete len:242 (+) Transcript_11893:598-1323(+)
MVLVQRLQDLIEHRLDLGSLVARLDSWNEECGIARPPEGTAMSDLRRERQPRQESPQELHRLREGELKSDRRAALTIGWRQRLRLVQIAWWPNYRSTLAVHEPQVWLPIPGSVHAAIEFVVRREKCHTGFQHFSPLLVSPQLEGDDRLTVPVVMGARSSAATWGEPHLESPVHEGLVQRIVKKRWGLKFRLHELLFLRRELILHMPDVRPSHWLLGIILVAPRRWAREIVPHGLLVWLERA